MCGGRRPGPPAYGSSLAGVGAQAHKANLANDGADVVEDEMLYNTGGGRVEHEAKDAAEARTDPHVHRREAQVRLPGSATGDLASRSWFSTLRGQRRFLRADVPGTA